MGHSSFFILNAPVNANNCYALINGVGTTSAEWESPFRSGSFTYDIPGGSSSGTTCSDADALNNGEEGDCILPADLKSQDSVKKAAAALVLKAQMADSAKKDAAIATIKAQVDKPSASDPNSGDRNTVKSDRRQQLKSWGVDASNWKEVVIEDTDFAGYTDKVLAKRERGSRKINYRFVPVGDHTVEISPGGAINAAPSDDPLESFDLDLGSCLTITVTDLGDIKVSKDTVGLTVACDTGAPVDKSAGDAVQCLGYEWDVGSLTYDGGCVQNASLQDHDSDPSTPDQCTCKPGYEVNDAGDACVADLCATDNAADYINAQCCQC